MLYTSRGPCAHTISSQAVTHRLVADGPSKVPDDEALFVSEVAMVVQLRLTRYLGRGGGERGGDLGGRR